MLGSHTYQQQRCLRHHGDSSSSATGPCTRLPRSSNHLRRGRGLHRVSLSQAPSLHRQLVAPCSAVMQDLGTPARTYQQQSAPSPSSPTAPYLGFSQQQQTLVPTHFVWNGDASSVEVVGSWSGWERPVRLHCAGDGHAHRAIISLPPGSVEYKYRVDGEWRTNLKEARVSSSEGILNNFRVVHPTLHFSVHAPEASRVFVVGDWDNWMYSMPLKRDPSTGSWMGNVQLKPNRYCYQYVLDSQITHNPEEECGIVQGRGVVNVGWAVEPDMFRIFYNTGWEQAVLEYRRVGPSGERRKGLESIGMVRSGGHSNVLGHWYSAVIVPLSEGESLEFFVHNGKEEAERKEDRPSGTHNRACAVVAETMASNLEGTEADGLVARQGMPGLYCLPRPGSFKLQSGAIKPFPRGAEPRFMLVSDIDGTMVGDVGWEGSGAFSSSGRFKEYWENAPVLSGSILVYNTGRSLGSVRELLRTNPQIAEPDAVVSAVGTKVFLNNAEVGRGHGSDAWCEDMEWTSQLDVGWDLEVVRKHARSLMHRYDSSQLHVLDDGSEHQHRFSLTADLHIVGDVVREMAENCRRDGLEVRLIASGNGSHRYVDCVPKVAGKEKALQYLRNKFDIPEHYCVAAGDSGNDILMLEGNHPAIVVGNAQPELLAWLAHQPQTGKVLLSDAIYADGIIEGLARHGLM